MWSRHVAVAQTDWAVGAAVVGVETHVVAVVHSECAVVCVVVAYESLVVGSGHVAVVSVVGPGILYCFDAGVD